MILVWILQRRQMLELLKLRFPLCCLGTSILDTWCLIIYRFHYLPCFMFRLATDSLAEDLSEKERMSNFTTGINCVLQDTGGFSQRGVKCS